VTEKKKGPRFLNLASVLPQKKALVIAVGLLLELFVGEKFKALPHGKNSRA
jgi:hypothetical protein